MRPPADRPRKWAVLVSPLAAVGASLALQYDIGCSALGVCTDPGGGDMHATTIALQRPGSSRAVDRAPGGVVGAAEAHSRRTWRVLVKLRFDTVHMVIGTRQIGIAEDADDRAPDLLGRAPSTGASICYRDAHALTP